MLEVLQSDMKWRHSEREIKREGGKEASKKNMIIGIYIFGIYILRVSSLIFSSPFKNWHVITCHFVKLLILYNRKFSGGLYNYLKKGSFVLDLFKSQVFEWCFGRRQFDFILGWGLFFVQLTSFFKIIISPYMIILEWKGLKETN